MDHYEASAKANLNVDEAFVKAAELALVCGTGRVTPSAPPVPHHASLYTPLCAMSLQAVELETDVFEASRLPDIKIDEDEAGEKDECC